MADIQAHEDNGDAVAPPAPAGFRMGRRGTIVSVVVPSEKNTKINYRPNCVQYSRILSLFYAIILMILGFVFPLTEALSQKWLESAASAVFIAYITGVGTIFLLYLQFYLLRKSSKQQDHPINLRSPTEPQQLDTLQQGLVELESIRKLDSLYEFRSHYDTHTSVRSLFSNRSRATRRNPIADGGGKDTVRCGLSEERHGSAAEGCDLSADGRGLEVEVFQPEGEQRHSYTERRGDEAVRRGRRYNRSAAETAIGHDRSSSLPTRRGHDDKRRGSEASGDDRTPDMKTSRTKYRSRQTSDANERRIADAMELLAIQHQNYFTYHTPDQQLSRQRLDIESSLGPLHARKKIESISASAPSSVGQIPGSPLDLPYKNDFLNNRFNPGNIRPTERIEINEIGSAVIENRLKKSATDNDIQLLARNWLSNEVTRADQQKAEPLYHSTTGSPLVTVIEGVPLGSQNTATLLNDNVIIISGADQLQQSDNRVKVESSNNPVNDASSHIEVIGNLSRNQVTDTITENQVTVSYVSAPVARNRVISVTPVLSSVIPQSINTLISHQHRAPPANQPVTQPTSLQQPVNQTINTPTSLQQRVRRYGFSGPATGTTAAYDDLDDDDDDNTYSDNNDDDDDVTGSASQLAIDDRREWIDVSKFGSIFSHGGSSFYLRIGALVFGLGNVVYFAVELRQVFGSRDDCLENFTHGWSFIPRLIFIIIQTFFLFKGSKVQITKQEGIAWFGLMHVMSTNMCLWFRTLISEIKVEFAHSIAHHEEDEHITAVTYTSVSDVLQPHHSAQELLLYKSAAAVVDPTSNKGDGSDADYENCNKLSNFVARYLFPLVLEYSIIAIGTFITIMHTGFGKDKGNSSLARGFKNLIKVSALNFIFSEDPNESGHHHEHKMLAKSHMGFFLGVLMIAISLISIVMYHVYDGDEISLIIFKASDILLHAAVFVACCAGFWLMKPLAHVDKPISVDDVLLLVAMIGSVTLEISTIVPAVTALKSVDQYLPSEDILHLTGSLIGAAQTVLQTMFILLALRCYPSHRDHVTKMPGRGCVAFLLLANVAVWLLRTFLGKVTAMKFATDYYGEVAWLLIMNINYPLLLFYRFHSSVCFADVWHVAYTPIHRKLPQLSSTAPQQQLQQQRSSGDGGPDSVVAVPEVTVFREVPTVVVSSSSSGERGSRLNLSHLQSVV